MALVNRTCRRLVALLRTRSLRLLVCGCASCRLGSSWRDGRPGKRRSRRRGRDHGDRPPHVVAEQHRSVAEVRLKRVGEFLEDVRREVTLASQQSRLGHLTNAGCHGEAALEFPNRRDRKAQRPNRRRARRVRHHNNRWERRILLRIRHDHGRPGIANFRRMRVFKIHPHHCAALHGFRRLTDAANGASAHCSISAASPGWVERNA